MKSAVYDQNIVVDLEFTPVPADANGLSSALRYEIIEIGAVRVTPDGRILDEFCCFVHPQVALGVSAAVQRLTGITTKKLEGAPVFEEALARFAAWVGEGRTRMVAWSGSDEAQMREECLVKGVRMPANMDRWLDLQRVFPYAMNMRQRRRCMSLHAAFEWFEKSLPASCEHEALQDAEHTAELLQCLLRGEHLEHRRAIEEALVSSEEARGYNVMAGPLAGLYAQMCGA